MYARVTEILGATASKKDQDRLRKWQQKMDKVHGLGCAETISEEARGIGTAFHSNIENFLGNKELNALDGLEKARWNYALPYLRLVKPHVISLELDVNCHEFQYSGRPDCVCWDDDDKVKRFIVDWKTSKRRKRHEWLNEYFLQATAYAIAYNEQVIARPIEECLIFIFSPVGAQQFSCKVADHRDDWIKRVKLYHSSK